MSSGKYNAPEGAPPAYMAPAHLDAGPADPRGMNPYGSPPPQGQQYGAPGPYQQPYQQPYGQAYQQPYPNQGPYGPPPQQYPPGQQPMYYQQQPMGGYYNQGRGTSAGEGICAGLLGALACCCCLDFMF